MPAGMVGPVFKRPPRKGQGAVVGKRRFVRSQSGYGLRRGHSQSQGRRE